LGRRSARFGSAVPGPKQQRGAEHLRTSLAGWRTTGAYARADGGHRAATARIFSQVPQRSIDCP
jgi:hypothetical protein